MTFLGRRNDADPDPHPKLNYWKNSAGQGVFRFPARNDTGSH
jgi:hypothetical protein